MMEIENLQNRKKEIIQQIGEEGLKKLKFSKILRLIENEIQELMNYWTIRQAHQMVNEIFNLNISAPLFYRFCGKNLRKNEKLVEVEKVQTKKDEKSINNIDDLTDSTLDFLSRNLPKKD